MRRKSLFWRMSNRSGALLLIYLLTATPLSVEARNYKRPTQQEQLRYLRALHGYGAHRDLHDRKFIEKTMNLHFQCTTEGQLTRCTLGKPIPAYAAGTDTGVPNYHADTGKYKRSAGFRLTNSPSRFCFDHRLIARIFGAPEFETVTRGKNLFGEGGDWIFYRVPVYYFDNKNIESSTMVTFTFRRTENQCGLEVWVSQPIPR